MIFGCYITREIILFHSKTGIWLVNLKTVISFIITINDQENNFNEYLTNAIGFDYEGALNKIKADRIELERQQ